MPEEDRPWFMYVVRCTDGTLYTGITTEIKRRVQEHNAGRGARYTRTRRPVKLVAAWSFDIAKNEDDDSAHVQALKAERRFKNIPRARKLAIIADRADWVSGTRIV